MENRKWLGLPINGWIIFMALTVLCIVNIRMTTDSAYPEQLIIQTIGGMVVIYGFVYLLFRNRDDKPSTWKRSEEWDDEDE